MDQTPVTESAFESDFTKLIACLGGTNGDLVGRLGPWDDVSADDNRSFVWYAHSKASFRIRGDRVDHLAVPRADAYGHSFEGAAGSFLLHGIHPGMSLNEVLSVWGAPHDKSDPSAEFGNRIVVASTQRRVILGPGCSKGATAYRSGAPFDHFWARLL